MLVAFFDGSSDAADNLTIPHRHRVILLPFPPAEPGFFAFRSDILQPLQDKACSDFEAKNSDILCRRFSMALVTPLTTSPSPIGTG